MPNLTDVEFIAWLAGAVDGGWARHLRVVGRQGVQDRFAGGDDLGDGIVDLDRREVASAIPCRQGFGTEIGEFQVSEHRGSFSVRQAPT